MKTSIIYNSHQGTTKAYAKAIGKYISGKGAECKVRSIKDYDKEFLLSSDLVLLGCWTSGLMIVGQHPDRDWKEFAAELPEIRDRRIALFTTYLIATGSMFRKMRKTLNDKTDRPMATLKARSSDLTDKNKAVLDSLMNSFS